jgi:hypothetical protein
MAWFRSVLRRTGASAAPEVIEPLRERKRIEGSEKRLERPIKPMLLTEILSYLLFHASLQELGTSK